MKKILVVLLLFVSANVYAEYKNSLVLKVGITPYSTLSQEIHLLDGTKKVKENFTFGTSISAEYFREINNIFALGIGVSHHIRREINIVCDLYSTSLYLTPKIKVYQDLYSVVQFGISNLILTDYLSGYADYDKKIGLHYGLGIGYTYKNFIFEFLYASDNTTYELKFPNIVLPRNVNYQTLNFNIGYKVDFNFPRIKRNDKEKQIKIKEKKIKKAKKID